MMREGRQASRRHLSERTARERYLKGDLFIFGTDSCFLYARLIRQYLRSIHINFRHETNRLHRARNEANRLSVQVTGAILHTHLLLHTTGHAPAPSLAVDALQRTRRRHTVLFRRDLPKENAVY